MINEKNQPRKKLAEAIDRFKIVNFFKFPNILSMFGQKVKCFEKISKNGWLQSIFQAKLNKKGWKNRYLRKKVLFAKKRPPKIYSTWPKGRPLVKCPVFEIRNFTCLCFDLLWWNRRRWVQCFNWFFSIYREQLTFCQNSSKKSQKSPFSRRSMASANFFLGWCISLIKGFFRSLKIYLLFHESNCLSRYYILT